MSAAGEHPRITGAIAALLALLLLVGMTAGGTLAGASSGQRAPGTARDPAAGELTTVRAQLHAARTQNAQLTGEVAALRARLASAGRSARSGGQHEQASTSTAHNRRRFP